MTKTLFISVEPIWLDAQVQYPWALEIINDPPADEQTILAAFAALA